MLLFITEFGGETGCMKWVELQEKVLVNGWLLGPQERPSGGGVS